MNGSFQSGGSVSQKAATPKDEKSVKCNVAFKDGSKWDEVDKKSSLDVVSFTFTSPIKKSGAGSNSHGFNVGGDALSVLLEEKLKELTSRVELSQKDMSETGSLSSPANGNGNMCSTDNLVKSLTGDNDTCKSTQEIQNASDCPIIDKLWLKAEKESKGTEYIESNGDNSNMEYQRYLHLQGSISASSRPSLSGASSDSFDVDRSSSYEGWMPCLSLESSEGMNWSSTRKSHTAEGDLEISDTASSLSVGTISETVTSSLYMTDSKDSSIWELQYIRDILSNAELLLEEFALGQAHKVMAPDLFDHLENKKLDSYKVMDEHVMLERKVLFDCVCECVEVRCGLLLSGSCKFWAKQMSMLHKKKWLADDLYREISSLVNDEELMVDELVDKDMSSKNGKWIDFEVEAFEEGVEIERRILTSLLDELIDDFLF
ncbi:hypothetical protein CDL12_18588 [Handroanthus impetiginosus]|uniref:DUF4378 domain-containing protein n=1 Tax=Handroanthus impetiginosus TaxID=429701 RepID=A0A2G9GU66_9LAMI|nr:hypothetical protein CDL12_18588 [Handroanthus impetiginosus]